MKYIVFSFMEGDYLRGIDGKILMFESLGLASQYLQANFHKPDPVSRTKRIVNYPKYYPAPFKMVQAV